MLLRVPVKAGSLAFPAPVKNIKNDVDGRQRLREVIDPNGIDLLISHCQRLKTWHSL
jgi:hypothetical protein